MVASNVSAVAARRYEQFVVKILITAFLVKKGVALELIRRNWEVGGRRVDLQKCMPVI